MMESARRTMKRQPGMRGFAIGMAAYVLLVVVGVLVLGAVADPPPWLGSLLAAGPVAAIVAALGSQRRGLRSREGVERAVLVEATSLAFYATALAAVTYGFLEAWAEAPKLSAWWVWAFAMASWGAASFQVRRAYR